MASSIVDKYEQIIAADPRSRIFVELAKALVERGDHARAVEVCQRGLEHHPSSILGRVVWGRALLESGDPRGAMDQFEIAIALDPASPYAYNHVGEALFKKGLFKEALPVLARAVELQPGDARVKGWFDEARAKLGGEAPAAPVLAEAPPPGDAGDGSVPGAGTPATPDAAAAEVAARADGAPATVAEGAPDATAQGGLDAAQGQEAAPGEDAADPAAANGAGDASADAPIPPETGGDGAARPPPLPPGSTPPPLRGATPPPSLLHLIPGATREMPAVKPAPRRAEGAHDLAEVDRIAQQYEREIRAKLSAVPEPPPSFVDRHRRLFVFSAIGLALVAAAAVYFVVDRRNADTLAKSAAGRARAGLARDTRGSLREAHRLLSEARRRSKADPETASLAAQVAAVLAVEHGDEDARALARELADDPGAGDGAIAARWLLAASPEQRKQAEEDVLAASPSSAPLLQALAARILLSRGETEAARGRLDIAAHANPPLLRALSDLGDLERTAGDTTGALDVYRAAIAAQPTHPRSVVGAAEARLAIGKELDVAARELAAVEADEASAPPLDLRDRFEIAFARALAGSGDRAAGAARLTRASEAHGESAPLAAALAELQLSVRAWDKAQVAAERAARIEPKESAHGVLLARARIGQRRFAEALAATKGHEGRAVRVPRAIARFRLGQYREAREELEATAQKGRMPADAAVWYALVDVATGRAARAIPLLERLASASSPPPLAQVALGRAYEAAKRQDDAEQAYRAAMEREPSEPEPAVALGVLLLSRERAADAIPPLERALELDGADVTARRALGEARLAEGKPAEARAALDVVLLKAPSDAVALKLLSAAWLAEKEPAEARRAAERAVSAAPKDVAARLAAARAALAADDKAAAKAHAERALKLGAKGDAAAEAKKIRAAASSRSK